MYKFLHNEMSLKDWNTVGGRISTWLSNKDHNVTSIAYLFSDRVYRITNMNRTEFHNITDTFANYFESEETTKGDKYIPYDIFLYCHNDAAVDNIRVIIKRNSRNSLSSMKIEQQDPKQFNEIISGWYTSNILTMEGTFCNASRFNQSLDLWDTSNVMTMKNMFRNASVFNNEIMSWDTHKVLSMESMFSGCEKFNMDISMWDMSSVVSIKYMFKGATDFKQEIRHWNLDKMNSSNLLESSHDVFDGSKHIHKMYANQTGFSTNPSLSFWKSWPVVLRSDSDENSVSNIKYAVKSYLDEKTHKTALVTYGRMCNWDVSQVTEMHALFSGQTSFNEDISQWDVSNVTSMKYMFRNCKSFNGVLSTWNTEKCIDMKGMFEGALVFNNDISKWNVENVRHMDSMFKRASQFTYSIRCWQVQSRCTVTAMFENSTNYLSFNKKFLSKVGTPNSNHFNNNNNELSVLKICALPGTNLIGFSSPGNVEVDNDVSMCNYEEIRTDYINRKGVLCKRKNALLPLLSSIKCNLAPGLYNNLPVVSKVAKGRYGKVSISVTNYNNIEEITVTEQGRDYAYNDIWNILLDSVEHKLIDKNVKTIQLSSINHKITELNVTHMRNGKKKYDIPRAYSSVWVNVPQYFKPRILLYRFNGKMESSNNIQLKKGKNYVGFSNSGDMTIYTKDINNYKIYALDNDNIHNTFVLNEDNFINHGIEFTSSKPLIGDIGKVYGHMTGNIKNVGFISRSGNGSGAVVDIEVKANMITSLKVKNIGRDYSVGDGQEIKHGIKYKAVLSASEELNEGIIHISKIREKMSDDLKMINSENNFHFTPGTYTSVPVLVDKTTQSRSLYLKNKSDHSDTNHTNHSHITCGSKEGSCCSFVLYMNIEVSETEVKSISMDDTISRSNNYSIDDLSKGDTISIYYGIFKTFFLSHYSVYQSCKGMNPSDNNLLNQISRNKKGIHYPEGNYTNIPLVTVNGNGKGATININIGPNNNILSVKLVSIGFGYSPNDILSLPVFKRMSNEHVQSDNISRALVVKDDTYVINHSGLDKEGGYKYKVEGPHRGYIVEVNDAQSEEMRGEHSGSWTRRADYAENYQTKIELLEKTKDDGMNREHMNRLLRGKDNRGKKIGSLFKMQYEDELPAPTGTVVSRLRKPLAFPESTSEEHDNNDTTLRFISSEKQMVKRDYDRDDESQQFTTVNADDKIIMSVKRGSTSFVMRGTPVYTNCLLIGGGGSGGKISFDSLNKGGNGGSAGGLAYGTITLQEGEEYTVQIGEGGKSQLNAEDNELENGNETSISISNIEENIYLEKYPSFKKELEGSEDSSNSKYVIIASGGISGNNEETHEQRKNEDCIGGDMWRYSRNKREVAPSVQNDYVGGIGGGGVISPGLISISSTNENKRKIRGGSGGHGFYWKYTGLSYGSGGSGSPNWGKPWQKITPMVFTSAIKHYENGISNIEVNVKQLLNRRSYKLKNAIDSREVNEIEKIHDCEIENMKSDLSTKLSDESTYIHGKYPCLPYFPMRMDGGGGGATSKSSGYTHGEENRGSGGSAGYWLYGTCYPNSDQIIEHHLIEPGNGGSGVVTFVYDD